MQQNAQPRQPRGAPTGGQFATKENPEPELELVPTLDTVSLPLDPLAYDDQEACDEIVPQANRPETIAAVVDAIADGCTTNTEIASAIGMSGRQGAYYPEAARSLGLVERFGAKPVEYALTERGAKFARMEASDRADAMNQILSDNEHVDTYITEGAEVLAEAWSMELSDATVTRRIATIKSWCDYYLTDEKTQSDMMGSAMTGTRERAPVVRAQRRHPLKKQVRHCPTCYADLPSGSDECGYCD
ncbi:MAG: DUF7226 domain-containing protein [Acidimicrobiales bacterium]